MRALLAAAGVPLAAPSANRSGAVSPSCAAHVAASLAGWVALVLDGGPSEAGIESTIVALREGDGWQILRPGPITEGDITLVLATNPMTSTDGRIEAPGQMTSHYAPGKVMRLNAVETGPDEFHIGFGPVAGHYNLSASGDLAQAAARLYAALHEASASQLPRVAVAPVPDEAIGAAINDRLRRAAA